VSPADRYLFDALFARVGRDERRVLADLICAADREEVLQRQLRELEQELEQARTVSIEDLLQEAEDNAQKALSRAKLEMEAAEEDLQKIRKAREVI